MFKKITSCLAALVLTAAFLPCTGVYATGPSVNIWVSQVNATDTGMAMGLAQQSSIQFDDDNESTINNLIIVDETNTYQTIDGFGASITEASAHLYQDELSSANQDSMMTALFDKETGIGLSMLRQTIGACDHCVAPYTFAPTEQADSLPDFDFSHELLEIFPTVQDALAVEPGRIKVMASSWSPPGWMKANGSELGMYNDVAGILLTSKYQAYANYITKFIQEYEHGASTSMRLRPPMSPIMQAMIGPRCP